MLARWPYDELDHLAAPEGVLRLGRSGARESGAARGARPRARACDRRGVACRSTAPARPSGAAGCKVVAWSVAAMVSLVLGAVFGVPALADRIAPLVPLRVERRLGEAVDAQVRPMLDKAVRQPPSNAAAEPGEAAGRAALGRDDRHGSRPPPRLPIPLRRQGRPAREANAIALPGGRIYVFQGLIEKAETPDELAGVIAHEIGHVAHRDGTRSILQAAGLSFLFGMLLGDFVGGGAVVIGARAVLQSSYSREVESAADRYGVDLMGQAGGDPRALGAMLARHRGREPSGDGDPARSSGYDTRGSS